MILSPEHVLIPPGAPGSVMLHFKQTILDGVSV